MSPVNWPSKSPVCASRWLDLERTTLREGIGIGITFDRDRRRLAQRTLNGVRRVSFTVRIGAARLRSGRHRIVVVAVDQAGNRKKVTKPFRRCARA